MSGEKPKGKISSSLIVAVVVIIVLLAALVYYATLPPKVEVVPTTVAIPTTIVTTAVPSTTVITIPTTVTTVAVTPMTPTPEKKEIIFWHCETPPLRVQRVEAVIRSFEREYPWIKIKQVPIGWDAIYSKLDEAIKTGTQPDVIQTIPALALYLYHAEQLLEVDDLVKEIDGKYHYAKEQLKMHYWDGHYWSVPTEAITLFLSYRENYIKEYAGYDRPPKTWDELLDMVKKCTRDIDGDGKIDIWGINVPITRSLATDEWFWQQLAVNNGEVFLDTQVVLDSPQAVEALKFYLELRKYCPPGSENWGWAEQNLAFASGKIAFNFNFGGALATIAEYGELAKYVKGCPVPIPKGGRRVALSFGYGMGILKKAEERGTVDAVKTFIRYIMDPANYGYWLNRQPGLFLPITEEGEKSPSFWADPVVMKFRPIVELCINETREHAGLWGFMGKETSKMVYLIESTHYLAEAVAKAATGEMTPEQAIKWAAEQFRLEMLKH